MPIKKKFIDLKTIHNKDSMSFFDKYCNAPAQVVPITITQEIVIENYKKHIDMQCKSTPQQTVVVKYSMPNEFRGKIDNLTFWTYILNFLANDMKFKCILASYGSSGMLFDSDYESMAFQTYYAVTEKESSHHGEYFMQDYNMRYENGIPRNISFVVFRIFKS